MNNLWLVIKREYITRVRRKSFILATLLTPLGLAVFFIVAQFIFSYGNDEKTRIAVVDQAGIFEGQAIPDQNGIYFVKTKDDPETIKRQIQEAEDGAFTAMVLIPEISNPRAKDVRVQYFSDESLSIDTRLAVDRRLEKALREYKVRTLGLDRAALAALETNVEIRTQKITVEEGERADTTMASVVGAGLGTIMGFLMYLSIFIYGMMVMRSVMEEKMNRIVEVIISTVKPTTLLLGKIIGVGAVGLTQVLAWMVLIPGVIFLVSILFGFDSDTAQQMQNAQAGAPDIDPEEMQSMVEKVIGGLATLNWWVIIPCFILYFIGGYFMYAALFAAVGSAMGDDMGESQSLTIPITIPVILALYIMMAAIQAPNSSLAVWSSFIPLFAPIVMPARLAFDPPVWQIVGSLLVVLLFAMAMVWLAARIYRVGILNYGKKSSLVEMGRWLFSKY